ncbi:hypothetical protein ACFOLF_26195 [Paenibacillus sepulcri]|uniref:Uncharacterized protein n=1 Tax=Paenibacillus sepulcri TaxID=359917 RepID=A0ABS7BY67_9BACL|nr:hypothetical protein [Paenibacillus sepulcri]
MGDIDIEFTNDPPQHEAFSFNKAFMSQERRDALQVGDVWPAVRLNTEKNKVILFRERKNGNVVYINILSRENEDGTREWFVEGPAEELTK